MEFQKTLETLTKLLKNDERLVANGELLKSTIIELTLKQDIKILKLLMTSPEIKRKFFTQVEEGILVFNQIKFQNFISNKQFLPDSFTQYKNKIGLVSNQQYLADNGEVVLAWPYKDCILEGGQTKEDAKRQEIFWNETLAPDEIDRLLEPKVLTEFQKYEKGIKIDDPLENIDDSLIIKGNNLLFLYSLKKSKKYQGKIKLVYIDPPYNPNNKSNTFCYNNTFNESTWLTFMKNRLEVVKELLTSDGCLIVAIDKNEWAKLVVLLEEIFKNYEMHCITIVHNPRGTQSKPFSYVHEYAIFVFKDKKVIGERKVNIEWQDFVISSNNVSDNLRTTNNNCFYPIIVENEKVIGFGEILESGKHPEAPITEKDGKLHVWPIDEKGIERRWRYTRKSIEKEKDRLRMNKKKNKIECKKTSETYKTVWHEKGRYDAGSGGTTILKNLLTNKNDDTRERERERETKIEFTFPKSLWNVYDCLYAVVGNDKNAIILDFFGGSGTTAHAVLELNKQDGGNRKFILCEQMDYIETVTRERIRKVCENNQQGSFIYCKLKLANQKFIDQIQSAKNTVELWKIWEQMKDKAFLSYQVRPQEIDATKQDFEELSFDNQKKLLITTLEKNHLYISYHDIDDETHETKKSDKKLNHQFYNNN